MRSIFHTLRNNLPDELLKDDPGWDCMRCINPSLIPVTSTAALHVLEGITQCANRAIGKVSHVRISNIVQYEGRPLLPANDVKLSSPLTNTSGDAILARTETLETTKSACVATTLDQTLVRDAEWMDTVCTRGYNAATSR